ncbi:hypothetical protein AB0D49_29155 [Streptomyces sp. NPDC048290]|uniref:hypothetical protein n=1 Tax=Streptomyces sp. NPDC048290 TaxID=3155811 RepID=UPI003416746A
MSSRPTLGIGHPATFPTEAIIKQAQRLRAAQNTWDFLSTRERGADVTRFPAGAFLTRLRRNG